MKRATCHQQFSVHTAIAVNARPKFPRHSIRSVQATGEYHGVSAIDDGLVICNAGGCSLFESQDGRMVEAQTYVFRASLNPKVYRDFEILSAKHLYDLGGAIVRIFGFDFDHAFGFYSKLIGSVFGSARCRAALAPRHCW